jgi:hypothetical protein
MRLPLHHEWYQSAARASGLPWRDPDMNLRFLTNLSNMDHSQPSHGVSMNYATSAPATAGGQTGSPVRDFGVFLEVEVSLSLIN